MDDKTAAGQLDTLIRLLEADGWGDHYIEAVKIGRDAVTERLDADQ